MSTNTESHLNTGRFAFLSNALNGEGGFTNGDYLTQYPRESDSKFKRRKDVAWYENHLRPACERFVGYLSKKPVTRNIEHPLVEAFSEDCDWKGNSLEIFMANFAVEVKARGCGLLLVEMPDLQPQSLEQQMTQRFFPYLVQLRPEDVRSYVLNAQGQLESVEIASTMMVAGKIENVVRGWDTTQWWVSLGGNKLHGNAHNLGLCPVLAFSEGSVWPFVGSFAQIADLSKRLFNLQSELDEILRAQTFSILTYQIPAEQAGQVDAGALAEAVGVNNMLVYHGTQAPGFAAPPSGPAEIYLKRIDGIETRIKNIGLTVDLGSSTSAESGVALTIRFQGLNAALAAFARKMEDLERRMFDTVARWLTIQNTVKTSYPKTFELSDLKAELETLALYQSSAFPEDVIRAKKQQIVGLDFSNLEAQELTELMDAIENEDAEVSVLESRVALLEAQLTPTDAQTQDNQDNQDANGGDQL